MHPCGSSLAYCAAMPATLQALSASLCWGVADYLGGVASRRHRLVAVIVISQIAGGAGNGRWCWPCAGEGPPCGGLPAAVMAGLFGVIAIASFYRAMAVGSISVAAPILLHQRGRACGGGADHGRAPLRTAAGRDRDRDRRRGARCAGAGGARGRAAGPSRRWCWP